MAKTVTQMERHLRSCFSTSVVNRVVRLANEFASLESFLGATKGCLMGVYSKLNPEAKKDLGPQFFRCFDAAARWFHEPEQEEPGSELAEFTVADLKKVLDFCELFNKDRMTLSEMRALLEMTKQKEAAP